MYIPRCARCNAGGVTNTKVVAVAHKDTPGSLDGDFLCVLHNHPTATKLPDNVIVKED